jgi:hypothetical protein
MNPSTTRSLRIPTLAVALLVALGAGSAFAGQVVTLTGANEVPPVTTGASGSGTITIGADGAVSGSVKTTGIVGTAAHIHLAGAGKNGPVIIPLTQGPDGTWSVPPGAKLDDTQMKAWKAGELYVNVHSAANKGGEIRAQIQP